MPKIIQINIPKTTKQKNVLWLFLCIFLGFQLYFTTQKRWIQDLVSRFYKKRSKKQKKSSFNPKFSSKIGIFAIAFGVVLFCAICFVVSDFASSLITHESSIFVQSRIEIPSNTFYCVSICDFEVEEDGYATGKIVEKKGGMGEVYQSGEYFVLCACYPTLAEAQEIRDNLCSEGNSARIINIKTPALDFACGKKKSELEYILQFPRKKALALYDLILQYDEGTMSLGTLNANLAKIYQETKQMEDFFASLKVNISSKQREEIASVLSFTASQLNTAIMTNENPYIKSSMLKKAMFRILQQNSSLFTMLND